MSDLPPGRWTPLLIGNHWPGADAVNSLATSSGMRHTAADSWSNYADLMRSARIGPLAGQDGQAAERIHDLFMRGEASARQIAEKNATKHMAYESARSAIAELRSALSSIAARGNAQIDQIEKSNTPTDAKVALIADLVADAQIRSNAQAARQSDNILDAIRLICSNSDTDVSPRNLVRTNGVKLEELFRTPPKDALLAQVAAAIGPQNSPTRPSENRVGAEPASLAQGTANLARGEYSDSKLHNIPQADQSSSATPTASATSAGEIATAQPRQEMRPIQPPDTSTASTSAVRGELPTNEFAPVHIPGRPIPSGPLIGPEPDSPIPFSQASSATARPSGALTAFGLSDAPNTALTPTDLVHGFNTGTQAGAPVSIGAEATSANAVHTAHQSPTHTPVLSTPPAAPAAPLTAGAEAAVAHAPTEPVAAPTVIATPQAPVAAATPTPLPTAVSTPAPPAGALPAYGADLRAPAATVPAASPTPAAPASAHLASSPTSGVGQPSVVRHQTAPPAAASATALTERAVAATASGSIAGAAAGHSTAQLRLRRLLNSVVRQAPKLGWAIGDRSDQTTVLTNDLASGWIPPNIRIPSGVTLLETAARSGSLTSMLGETTLLVTHIPGQLLPQDSGDIPPTSTRPRKTPPVDELNWELAQATKWRDGLPRLAHTLARAIASGTGYLDSEVSLLQEALNVAERRALGTYPNTDLSLIGNWQLLATIDALVRDEAICANYHLAWFSALSSTGRCKR